MLMPWSLMLVPVVQDVGSMVLDVGAVEINVDAKVLNVDASLNQHEKIALINDELLL